MDPVILSSIAISLFVWAVGGGAIYLTLRHDCPGGFQRLWFTAVCGPVAHALGLWSLGQHLRRRVLSLFGVGHYSCGCGGIGHGHGEIHQDWEPSPKGRRNDNRNLKLRGYPADRVLNQP